MLFLVSILAASASGKDKQLILPTNLRSLMVTNTITRRILHPTALEEAQISEHEMQQYHHQTVQTLQTLQKAKEITDKILRTNEKKYQTGSVSLIAPTNIEKMQIHSSQIAKLIQPIASLSTPEPSRSLSINPIISASVPAMNSSNSANRPLSFPFKCPLCLLNYRSQTYLNEHMRKEHSVLI